MVKFKKFSNIPFTINDIKKIQDYVTYSKDFFKKLEHEIELYNECDSYMDFTFCLNVIDEYKKLKEKLEISG